MVTLKTLQIIKLHIAFICGLTFLGLFYISIMSTDERCIFCKICAHKEEAAILYEDGEFIVFKDIKPATEHHYLVIPKIHIKGANVLTKEHLPMLEKMEHLAKQILQEQGASLDDIRLGFHWPPFNSINHLHLHAMGPAKNMGIISKSIFKPDSFWFVTLDYMYIRLNKL
ncbi:adenosine 5'-monophosphoramidase HINT3-like [Onthophagus taurus]|uniref:adenosine 5'-monophosphoramidase HINT3-like n=1 Tax=Onthophagus taurus TaxID=166361 RepID=UPI000C2020DA|nr:histidine triad nucleotide-binding protein 3-like [Onthophagus taurus]